LFKGKGWKLGMTGITQNERAEGILIIEKSQIGGSTYPG